MSKDLRLTITVPEAGKKYFGLSVNAAYAAAKRGDIPTIRIGSSCECLFAHWNRCSTTTSLKSSDVA